MRLIERNKTRFQYRTFLGDVDYIDGEGYKTGESDVSYSDPVSAKAYITGATGAISNELFGTSESYDKVIVTEDMDIPITENSLINIETVATDSDSPYDYIVKRVTKSLTHVNIAITKVATKVLTDVEDSD